MAVSITILNDNRPSGYLASEHGLAMLIDADEKILFDTGPSDVFLRNAEKMHIDLDDVHTIVLSHGHWDHGNGLPYLFGDESSRRLICHPAAFEKKYRKKDHSYIGLSWSQTEVARHFLLRTSKTPVQVTKKIYFLGEIPRNNDFEARTTEFETENGTEDFVPDDSGIAIRTAQGMIVITGCGHAGICNTIDHARNVTGDDRIVAVFGGFHLKKDDEVTRKTVDCFLRIGVKMAYPSHCTALPALVRFYLAYRNPFVSSGDKFVFED